MTRDIDWAKFVEYGVSSSWMITKLQNKDDVRGFRWRWIFFSLWLISKNQLKIDFRVIACWIIDFSPWRRAHYILLTPDSESTCISTCIRVLKIKFSDPFFGYEDLNLIFRISDENDVFTFPGRCRLTALECWLLGKPDTRNRMKVVWMLKIEALIP